MKQTKIAYGVYNQYKDINHLPMYLRLKGATLFYIERLSNHLVTEHKDPLYFVCRDSIEEVLKDTLDKGYDYCVMQSAGCMIKSFTFDDDVRQFIKDNRFGVAGHPLWQPGQWLELQNQFFIVNLKAWAECGSPNYGDWHEEPTLLPIVERSEENFHDDYTPLWVKYAGKCSIQEGAGQGWQILSAMFVHGWPVLTLPEKIRFSKFYTYPDHETEQFEQSIKTLTPYEGQNWNQNKLVVDALNVKDQIWLFNSEDMGIYNEGVYDLVVNTASGFKLFDLLKNNRLTKDARCVVYDFNPKSIAWYKHFYTWHNEDLLECIRAFPDRNNFTWISNWDPTYTENHGFHEGIKEVFQHFNSKEEFASYWRTFKSMPVEFMQVDLYREPEKFAKLFVGPGKKWTNLTNIFSTDATQVIHGHVECMAAQARCLGYLFVVDPEIDVTFYDFWGRSKTGTLKEII